MKMQKKLIALAVAGVLAAPLAAQAGVEVYGQARMSLDFSSNNDPATGFEDSALAVSSNKSRLGFKGDEDLGGGLKGLWQFEQRVDFDTGNWSGGGRDTFLGLGGDFGTVLVGRINTPYKNSTQGMDIFIWTRGDYNAIMGMVNTAVGASGTTNFNNRFDNSIQYRTPDMSGFKGAVAYSVNTGSDNLAMTTAASEKDAYSLSGSYTQGPLFLTAAYESLNSVTPVVGGFDDAAAWKIGGTFALGGMTTLGAIWESADLGGPNADRDAWYLNVAHKMDALTLKAAFTMADEVGGVADTGATQFALGAAYALSKTTEAYALYTIVGNDSAARYTVEQVGGVTGQDVSSFSVGLNHTFSSK
jgi:predicted porin